MGGGGDGTGFHPAASPEMAACTSPSLAHLLDEISPGANEESGGLNEPPATLQSPGHLCTQGAIGASHTLPWCAERAQITNQAFPHPCLPPSCKQPGSTWGWGWEQEAVQTQPPRPTSSWQDYDLDSQGKRRGLRLPHRRQDLLRHQTQMVA